MSSLYISSTGRLRQETGISEAGSTTLSLFIKPESFPVGITSRLLLWTDRCLIDVTDDGTVRLRDLGGTVFPTITSAIKLQVGVTTCIQALISASTAILRVGVDQVGSSTVTAFATARGFHIGESGNGLPGEYADVRLFSEFMSGNQLLAIANSEGRDDIYRSCFSRWIFTEVPPGVAIVANSVKNLIGFTGNISPDGTAPLGGDGSTGIGYRRRIK